MLKKKKPTKALEKCARAVKDADDFVEHVANIADRYRLESALDAGARNAAVRKSLRDFQKHTAVLVTWLQHAQQTKLTTAGERDALGKISAVMYGVPSMAHAESKSVLAWLMQAEQAALQCLVDAKLLPRKSVGTAANIAADALRATFEHHKLKWSATLTKKKQGDAVRLLCAIAKGAGDVALTPELACTVLRAVDEKTS